MTGKRVMVVEGLFDESGEGPYLIGSRCKACDAHYFPEASSCNRPSCLEPSMERTRLSQQGTIWSYTVQHYPPPPPFKFSEPFSPYAIGLVELPEGIRVLGIIAEDPEKVRVGMNVRLIIDTMYVDDEGNDVVTWKFRPAV